MSTPHTHHLQINNKIYLKDPFLIAFVIKKKIFKIYSSNFFFKKK